MPIVASFALLAVTTAALWLADAPLRQEHLIFIYFVPAALIAIRYGSLLAMGVAVAGAVAAAFLFYPPLFSFKVENPLELLELVLFSLLALLASQVVSGFAGDRDVAQRRVRPKAAPFNVWRRSSASFWKYLRGGRS
jgi:K+-sensing histidine kinase KdpD